MGRGSACPEHPGLPKVMTSMTKRSSSEDEKYSTMRRVGLLTTIPLILAISPVIGFFIGDFLDGWLGTEPYLMIVFVALGFVAGAREVYRLVKKAYEDESPQDKT
jgi:ATP synthase protein I